MLNLKRIFALLMAFSLLVTPVLAEETESADGAWEVAEDTSLTEERLAVFEKALDGLVGVDYNPLCYLGSQVVAGTNHCFLCRATVVYPGAEAGLALVYVYEDLEGQCELSDIVTLELGTED